MISLPHFAEESHPHSEWYGCCYFLIKSVSAVYCWEVNKDTKVEWLTQEFAGRGEFRHQGLADSRRWDRKTSAVPWDCINHCETRKCECLCQRWDLWHRHKWLLCSYKGECLRQFHILNWCHSPWYLELLIWFHKIVRFLPNFFFCEIFSLCFQLSEYYLLASIAGTETSTIPAGWCWLLLQEDRSPVSYWRKESVCTSSQGLRWADWGLSCFHGSDEWQASL